MRKLDKIKLYPSNFDIFDSEGDYYCLDFDGLTNELTEAEWKEDPIISQFDEESQDKILWKIGNYVGFAGEEEEEEEGIEVWFTLENGGKSDYKN